MDDELGQLLPPLSSLFSPFLSSSSMDLSDISEGPPIPVCKTQFEGLEKAKADIAEDASAIVIVTGGDLEEHEQRTDNSNDDVDKLASRLADELIQPRGCCKHCHRQLHKEHAEKHANYYELQEYLDQIPGIMNWPDILGREQMATREKNFAGCTDAAAKRQIFCGVEMEDPTSPPAHICLETEDRPIINAEISFDIDNVIGFPSSLVIAKQGIR